MLAEERKRQIMDILRTQRVVKVTDLSQTLATTEATVRRDLEELQKQHKVRRVHGGATLVNPASKGFTDTQLATQCIEEKQRIARTAYNFIADSDALIMDGSTTALELAKLIAGGPRASLSVITNSFGIVRLLGNSSKARVIHTGGQVVSSMNYALGVVTENMIRNLKADKCFLGTNGIDPEYGYSVPTFEDASVKKAMLRAAKHSFVLADHTKFGDTYMGKFAPFAGEIDTLITDTVADNVDLEVYQSSVNLLVADE